MEFHRQVLIDNYIVDFYCYELILTVEIHENSHNFEEAQLNDITRHKKLEDIGVTFIRFEYKVVKQNINEVVRQLQVKI